LTDPTSPFKLVQMITYLPPRSMIVNDIAMMAMSCRVWAAKRET